MKKCHKTIGALLLCGLAMPAVQSCSDLFMPEETGEIIVEFEKSVCKSFTYIKLFHIFC